MIQIEVTDQVKTILDCYINQCDGMFRNYPKTVGKWTYSDAIMWLHIEVGDERAQTLSDKDFGRLSG